MRYAYSITLTKEEYQSAMYMSDRGYLGEITIHASTVEDNDDGTFTLKFTEPDAWNVQSTIDDDPDAVWSLTTPNTSLGEKFDHFVNAIV